MTVLPQHVVRRLVGAVVGHVANTEDEGRLRHGVVTAVNADGTVRVSIDADPNDVSATRYAADTYMPGDLVHVVRQQKWAHVVGKIAGPGQ